MTDVSQFFPAGRPITRANLLAAFASLAPNSLVATGASQPRAAADRAADAPSVFDFATPDRTGATDCSVAIKAAHDAAFALGVRYLFFPRGTYFAPTLAACGNVIFVGDGILTGAYRKTIFPVHTEARPVVLGDISPTWHAPALNAQAKVATTGNPVVILLLGDSTTTFASAAAKTEDLEEVLRAWFQREFPGVPYTVVNRGIGGMTWATMDGNPGSYPFWYTDHTRDWLLYGEDANAHLTVLNFGMNDGGGTFDATPMRSVVNKIKTWPRVPDLLFVANVVPTLQQPVWNSQAGQEGRECVADYTRSFARRYRYGLIDFGHAFDLVRDGFDRRTSVMRDLITGAAAAIPFTMPAQGRDWFIGANFPANFASMWSNGRMLVQIGSRADNVLILEKDGGTSNLAYTVMLSSAVATIARTVTGIGFSSGGFLDIAMKQEQLTVLVNGTTVIDTPVERYGGLYTPAITFDAAGGATVPFTAAYAGVGVPLPSMPTAIDFELYGEAANNSNPAAPGYPYASVDGGGGLNHMASGGIQRVMRQAFFANRLSV